MKFEDNTIINVLKNYHKAQRCRRVGGAMSVNGKSNKVNN
jgi:hypothetical protein